ncbi:MAG: hypothetical protein WBF73_05245, partial [Bradyrhizobium sp.]
DELTGGFGGAFEPTSIDGCRLFCRLAEISSHGVLGLLQHYRHKADVSAATTNVCYCGKSGRA